MKRCTKPEKKEETKESSTTTDVDFFFNYDGFGEAMLLSFFSY